MGEPDRSTYLGGGDIGALCGVGYSSEWKVYAAKRGFADEEVGPQLEWGNLMETPTAQWWSNRTGLALVKGSFAQHPSIPFIGGHPDFLTEDGEGVLECKNVRESEDWKWGPDGGTGKDCDQAAFLQVQFYAGLLGRPVCHVAACIGGNDGRRYAFPADPEVYAAEVELMVKWWNRHVLAGEPPVMTGETAARKYLSRLHPSGSKELLPTTPGIDDWGWELAKVRADLGRLKDRKETLSNHFRSVIGAALGVQGPWGRAIWSGKEGNRRFLFYPSKEAEALNGADDSAEPKGSAADGLSAGSATAGADEG